MPAVLQARNAQSTRRLQPRAVLVLSQAQGRSSGADGCSRTGERTETAEEDARVGEASGLRGTICGVGPWSLACRHRGTGRWGQHAGCGHVSGEDGSSCEDSLDKPKLPSQPLATSTHATQLSCRPTASSGPRGGRRWREPSGCRPGGAHAGVGAGDRGS